MKRILISVALVGALSFTGYTTPQSVNCSQTAKELELRISNITRNLDKAAFEEFVSDDVVIINATGETLTKKQQTASFAKPPNIEFSFRTIDVKIRVCGEDSIVTTGKDIVEARDKGTKEVEAQSYWFTRIYEKRQGHWQLVLNQLTSTNE
jgi:ketosteroid isomerase-like protein